MVAKLNPIKQIFQRVKGSRIEFNLKSYEKRLSAINDRGEILKVLNTDELKEIAGELSASARAGVPLDDLMVDAFALVREVSSRVLGLRPYETQIIAGMALHNGRLAEMQTGEGKTLAAVMPAYLNALTGKGVHILTFNDYLARRDAEWMGPVFQFLNLSVGFVQDGMRREERQKAYNADITYLTAKEAGFDFLRDHLCTEKQRVVHRPFHYAIIDEADSNLIDEARVPLVIAGSEKTEVMDHYVMADIVRSLTPIKDYRTDEFSRNVHLTDHGLDSVEFLLKCGSLHDPENMLLLNQLHHALHAEVLLRRDIDYIVQIGKVAIIDEFTGRVVENRKWPEGLQAAVEAKEKLAIQPEGRILGTITLQQFIRSYPKICGMTATAQDAAEEFHEFYDLAITVVPPHEECIRVDDEDRVFSNTRAKNKALLQEIRKVHCTGRPILVGTQSVEESEKLAELLQVEGITCQVLNAKNDEWEARIIAHAGALHAVTISTNMAGRGTDIRLGGVNEEDRDQVVALGGLYVIGTNRHESRRIDDQLRGRAGRQGDPGTSRFFISLTDDLIMRYGIQQLIPAAYRNANQEEPLHDPAIGREIARAQRIIENENFEIRRTLYKYSIRLEQHRREVYQWRRDVLFDRIPLNLFSTKANDRYWELAEHVDEAVLRKVEKKITLYHIDQCWADHLALMAHIREGVYLFSFSMQNPLDEYHRQTADAFRSFQKRIRDRILMTFHCVEITENGIDLEKEGMKGPSSTWTYLVSDNPMGDWLNRFFNGIHKALSKSLKF